MFEDLVSALRCGKRNCECARWNGDGNLHCPVKSAHKAGDANPGLTTRVGGTTPKGEPRIVFDCKRGCSSSSVLEALTSMGVWPPPKSDVPMVQSNADRVRPKRFTKEWPYKDEHGKVLAWKTRLDFTDAQGGKTFTWRLDDRPAGEYGLFGLKLDEMPLYNLEGVLDEPDETVYLVEGEKSADACMEHGLVACCLGGGSGQKSFGKSLDVLKGRKVVLWPDNDEPGYAYMTRIQTELPRAEVMKIPEWLTPIPDEAGKLKGKDAADFFADPEGRGTVELIAELIQSREPRVRWEGDDERLVVTIPGVNENEDIDFIFEDWAASPGKFEANTIVRVGQIQDDEYETEAHLNFMNLSQMSTFTRQLKEIFPGQDRNWTRLLARATRLAKNTYTSAVRSVDLAEKQPDYTSLYRVEDLLPECQLTIVFGPGGSGKTNIVIDLLLALLTSGAWMGKYCIPVKSILYVDWEADEESVRRRLFRQMEGRGHEPDLALFHYFNANGRPLSSLVKAIRAEMRRTGAEIVVIDSAAPACGGKPEDSDAALGMFNAIKKLHTTVILIAHVNRAGDKFQPYGSVFWHNEARATWYLEQTKHYRNASDVRFIDVVMHNRKMNDDEAMKPIPLTVEFTGKIGMIRILDGKHTSAAEAADEPQSQTAAVEQAVIDAGRMNPQVKPGSEWIRRHIEDRWPQLVPKGKDRIRNICADFVKRGIMETGKIEGTRESWWRYLLDTDPPKKQLGLEDAPDVDPDPLGMGVDPNEAFWNDPSDPWPEEP